MDLSHLRPAPSRPAGGLKKGLRFAATASLALVAAFLAISPAGAQVTIDWVTVGDTGAVNGGVSYAYRIGKYEVTIQQYADFLNAAAKSDPYGLYDANMETNLNIAGISRTGVSGSYQYSVMNNNGNSSNRPITYVSWFDAARFANWMQNGQGAGNTETGAYTLNGTTSGSTVALNAGAQFSIPTEMEWTKAAYFSPLLNSGSGGYYTYATQSNTAPGNTIGGGGNQANYYAGDYAVTQSAAYSSSQNYVSDVGALTASVSYYGTFDQSGNVREWNAATIAAMNAGVRGGGWGDTASSLSISVSGFTSPSAASSNTGFRLASPVPVPEPSTWVMGAGGLACAAWTAWRRRKRV